MFISVKEQGFTLIEVVLVVVILGILSTVAIRGLTITVNKGRFDATTAEMEKLARAIAGDERLVSGGFRTDFGYVGDVGALPPNLNALVTNPGGYSTWEGPYFQVDFTENPEDYERDAWNELYTYSGGVTIVSSGGGSAMTKQFANSASDLTSNTVNGVVRDSELSPPGHGASNVGVTIQYPDGAGSVTSASTSPNSSGEFSFVNSIPIGLHLIRATVGGVTDTVAKYLAVYPGKKTITELRFPANLWSGSAAPISYVDGSGQATGGGKSDIEFEIQNTSSATMATITSLRATYTSSPQAYYVVVKWDGTNVFDNAFPPNGSGDIVSFDPRYVSPGQTVKIEIEAFKDNPAGGGFKVSMQGVTFTILLSDGTLFDFTTL